MVYLNANGYPNATTESVGGAASRFGSAHGVQFRYLSAIKDHPFQEKAAQVRQVRGPYKKKAAAVTDPKAPAAPKVAKSQASSEGVPSSGASSGGKRVALQKATTDTESAKKAKHASTANILAFFGKKA